MINDLHLIGKSSCMLANSIIFVHRSGELSVKEKQTRGTWCQRTPHPALEVQPTSRYRLDNNQAKRVRL